MIAAFVYDFPHFKSAQGLFALKRAGFNDVVAIGAPWRKLDVARSALPVAAGNISDAHHPREAAAALGYHYLPLEHDGDTVRRLMQSASAGIVLGARILPPEVVDAGAPIVNLHPGVLPLNRGLDTIKWAVHQSLPQAIAVHVIDRRIDRGQLLYHELVDVEPEDTLADVCNRLMWRQIANVAPALQALDSRLAPIGKGIYRRPMLAHEDAEVLARFDDYKRRYRQIEGDFVRVAVDLPAPVESFQ